MFGLALYTPPRKTTSNKRIRPQCDLSPSKQNEENPQKDDSYLQVLDQLLNLPVFRW